MPQPDFVPVRSSDKVRPDEQLPVPHEWRADRPGEIRTPFQPEGPQLGSPGPDQGYGLKLAKGFVSKLVLRYGENAEDAVAGCLPVALRRASLFGRAPVIYDFELAFTLWGYLGTPPEDLIAVRKSLFESASHHYEAQRAIADCVHEPTLRMSPAQVTEKLDDWRTLVSVDN